MKLIGSKIERDLRNALLQSNDELQAPDSLLRKALQTEGHDTKHAYILDWIPEQSEDLYQVLIDGSYLVEVEINNDDSSKPAVVERRDLKPYLHGLSKMKQVKLAVAQDLVTSKK